MHRSAVAGLLRLTGKEKGMSVTSLALEAVAPWCVALFLSFVGVSGLWLRRQTLGAGAAISGDSGHFEASHGRETP